MRREDIKNKIDYRDAEIGIDTCHTCRKNDCITEKVNHILTYKCPNYNIYVFIDYIYIYISSTHIYTICIYIYFYIY